MFLLPVAMFCSCGSSRHVPKGSYLLDKVDIRINDSTETFDSQEMMTYLRQLPNHKMLWSTKFRLGIYNMSGNDTTKWWNRWIRKLGEPPVIYDSTLTATGSEQLLKAMVNKGFLEAEISTDTIINEKKRQIKLEYTLTPGKPHIIKSIDYVFPDSSLRTLVMADSGRFVVKPGRYLDRTLLETQRELITQLMRNNGYYGFANEYISF